MQHALPYRAAPEHGDGKGQDEQEEAVVALVREGQAQGIALVRKHVGSARLLAEGADIGDGAGFGRNALRVSEAVQRRGDFCRKLQRFMREDALGEDERAFGRNRDAKRRACADQLLRLIGEEHVDVAAVLLVAEIGVAQGKGAVAQPAFLTQTVEEGERFLELRLGRSAAHERERRQLALGRGGGQHDAHMLFEILPAVHVERAVLAHGEHDDSEVVRIPMHIVR